MCPWNTDAPAGTQVNGQTDRETWTICNFLYKKDTLHDLFLIYNINFTEY